MRLYLKFMRMKDKKTQREVAEAVGISVRSLSQIELGKQTPCYENMKKLSAFYDVPVETLFTDDTHDLKGDDNVAK